MLQLKCLSLELGTFFHYNDYLFAIAIPIFFQKKQLTEVDVCKPIGISQKQLLLLIKKD